MPWWLHWPICDYEYCRQSDSGMTKPGIAQHRLMVGQVYSVLVLSAISSKLAVFVDIETQAVHSVRRT